MDVPDLRVAHKSITEADGETVRVECAVTVLFCNGVHVSRVASINRIPLHVLLWGDAPSVVNAVPVY